MKAIVQDVYGSTGVLQSRDIDKLTPTPTWRLSTSEETRGKEEGKE